MRIKLTFRGLVSLVHAVRHTEGPVLPPVGLTLDVIHRQAAVRRRLCHLRQIKAAATALVGEEERFPISDDAEATGRFNSACPWLHQGH